MKESHFRAEVWSILSLALLAALPFAITLDGFPVADDIRSVLRGAMPENFPILKDPVWTPKHFFRPMIVVLCRLDGWLWGGQIWGYRLSNVLLLAATAVLTYLFIKRFYRPAIAWLAAAVIAVHPTQVFTTAWITGRVDLVPGFLLTFSLLVLTARKGRIKLVAGNVLFAAALFSKEVAITFPAIILLGGLLLHKESFKAALVRAGPSIAVVAVYLAVRYAVDFWPQDSFYSPIVGSNIKGWGSNFLFLAHNIAYLVIPIWNPIDLFRELHVNSNFSPESLILISVYLLAGAALLGYPLFRAARKKRFDPVVLFGVLWFFIALVPTIHVMRNLGGSRYLFPALPGVAIAVAAAADWFSARYSRGKILTVLILFVLLAANVFEQTRWRAAMDVAEKTTHLAAKCTAGMNAEESLAVFNLPGWVQGRPVYPWYEGYSLNLAHFFITGGSNIKVIRGRDENRDICLRENVRCIEWSGLMDGKCP